MSSTNLQKNVSPPAEKQRVPSILRVAGAVLGLLALVAAFEYLATKAGLSTLFLVFMAGLGAAVVISFIFLYYEGVWRALSSVNLAVVLLAFVGIQCALGTLSLQKSDIERLSPEEQTRQFKFAEGSFLYHLFGKKSKEVPALDEKSETYYRLLSEKFDADYGRRQRKKAVAGLEQAVKDKEIEKFIADHDRLLNGLFKFMEVSGLFHAHSAWWFRITMLLLALNLIFCTVERYKGRLRQTGFLLTHAGVLVIFIGATVGVRYEQKGMMQLHLGSADKSSAFFDERAKQVAQMGFTVQLAKFKTIFHRELFVEFLDVPAAGLPENAALLRPYKVIKGKEYLLDGGKLKLRLLDTVDQAVVESKIINLTNEPKNPAVEVKVIRGDSTDHKWLYAQDAETVYVDKSGDIKIRFVRPASDAELQDELAKAKESSFGRVILQTVKEGKKHEAAIRAKEKIAFEGYTVEIADVQPNFRISESAPSLGPAVRLAIAKGEDKEARLVFQNFDFDQMHRPKFDDLKIGLAMPAWNTPAKVKCLIAQKGDGFSLHVVEDKSATGPAAMKPGEAVAVAKTDVNVVVAQYFPDAGLERNVVPILTKPSESHAGLEDIAQPAVQLEVEGPGFKKTEWLLAGSKEAGIFEQPGYVRVAYADNTDKMPQEWRSHLLFLEEGQPVFSGVARVNHPVYFRGYTFYQTDAKTEDPGYSGIQVVYDPSWQIVNLGLLSVIIGVLFTFYVKPYLKKSEK